MSTGKDLPLTVSDLNDLWRSIYDGIDVGEHLERVREARTPVLTEHGTIIYKGMEIRIRSVESA